jgi:NAD+ synthase
MDKLMMENNSRKNALDATVFKLDCSGEVDRICGWLRHLLSKVLRRRGLVVAVSGGIDSSATLALAVEAVGKDRVLALLMPERHSADDTLSLSRLVVDHFKVEYIHEEITPMLEAAGFYHRYDEAVQRVIPAYGSGWKSKIAIANVIETTGFNLFSLVAQSPEGRIIKERLPLTAYLEIVAATNFKQRIRKMSEYYHADRMNYAVTGTPNRLEYDQGFFVKLGDGAADVKPIAHLYKTQVYQLAEHLGVPEKIRQRPPTTDTYSLAQGQDEFYFSLPYDKMDLCLYAKNNGYPAAQVAKSVGLTAEQVERVFADIVTKRATTRYLHLQPQLIEEIEELD